MTDQKKLKRAIRARSEKTGESYTAARHQVLQAKAKTSPASASPALAPIEASAPIAAIEPAAAPVPPPAKKASAKKSAVSPAAQRGQVNDEAARRQTGHGLDHWFALLDAFGAGTKGHTASARHLHQEHGIPGWYAQGITVAYERQHGLREVNQACTGGFQVSVTKTVPAPLAQVVAAFTDPARRKAWLEGAEPELAKALNAAFTGLKPKEVKVKGSESARLRYRWGASTIEIRLNAKSTGTSVAADNMDLDDASQVEPRRTQWKEALEGLRAWLAG